MKILISILIMFAINSSHSDEYLMFVENYEQTNWECLAEALYFEAGVEGSLGMYLVGNTIMNRVKDRQHEFKYLNTVCDVVHQPSRNKSKPWECAFSYYCDSKPEIVPNHVLEQKAMYLAKEVAAELLSNKQAIDFTEGALYYTQPQVERGWMKNTEVTIVYLNHVFRKPVGEKE